MDRAIRRKAVLGMAILVAVLLVYGPHLGNGLVYDDHYQIEKNPHLGAGSSWTSAFREGTWEFLQGHGSQKSYYRPVMFLGYRVAQVAGGGDPRAFHLLSLILHLGCVWLAWVVLGGYGVGDGIRSATVLLFALHPLGAESVCWMGALQEPIVLLGLLATLALLQLALRVRGPLGASLALMAGLTTAFGLLGKETGVVIPLLATLGALREQDRRVALMGTLPSWLAMAVCLLVRAAVLGASAPGGPRPPLWLSLGRAARALLTYLQMLVFPWPLTPVHSFPRSSSLETMDVLAMLALGGFVIAAAFAWRRPGWRLWAAWLLIPLLPPLTHHFSDRKLLSGVVIAERHLYVSLLPALLALVALGARVLPARARMPVVLLAAALGGVLSHSYGSAFRDDLAYFTRAQRHHPDSSLVLNQLAAEHLRRDDRERAIPLLRRALELEPEQIHARLNLATALLESERAAEAAEQLAAVVQLDPSIGEAQRLLAKALVRSGRPAEAVAVLERILLENPEALEAKDDLATLLYLGGDRATALRLWQQVAARDPGRATVQYNLGVALREAGDPEGARPHLLRFLEVSGEDHAAARAQVRAWLGSEGAP